MRTVMAFTKLRNLKLVHFAYIHSNMSHRTVFWANWTPKVFYVVKIIVRISFREIIKNFSTLPLAGEYLFSAILFIVYNNEKL